eukprot:TRINITY_DN8746_c0_g1_i2.p1 TRINITY_DN8746_c0_g1~~TRINITY_DN8746_c0_g1_i2.p1  ORF type:complete len:387 (-),score=64.26 TRINITY_DN8746_c0_g1_i2:110-1270(-)
MKSKSLTFSKGKSLSKTTSSAINFVDIVQDRRSQKSFRDVFLQSNALEISVASALHRFPTEQAEIELLTQLLTVSLKPGLIDIPAYIGGLKKLSQLQLTDHYASMTSQTISVYKYLSRYHLNSQEEMNTLIEDIELKAKRLMHSHMQTKGYISLPMDILSDAKMVIQWVKDKQHTLMEEIELYKTVESSIQTNKINTMIEHLTNMKLKSEMDRATARRDMLLAKKKELEEQLAMVNAGLVDINEKIDNLSKMTDGSSSDARSSLMADDYIVDFILKNHTPLVKATLQQQTKAQEIQGKLNQLYEQALQVSISAQTDRVKQLSGTIKSGSFGISIKDLESDKMALQEAVYSIGEGSPLVNQVSSLDEMLQEIYQSIPEGSELPPSQS